MLAAKVSAIMSNSSATPSPVAALITAVAPAPFAPPRPPPLALAPSSPPAATAAALRAAASAFRADGSATASLLFQAVMTGAEWTPRPSRTF